MVLTLPRVCSQAEVSGVWRKAVPAVGRLKAGDTLTLDADAVESLDGAGEALLLALYLKARRNGFAIDARDARGAVARTLARYSPESFAGHPEPAALVRDSHLAEQLGESAVALFERAKGLSAFLGETAASAARVAFSSARLRWRDVWLFIEKAGSDAVPITMLIGFLLGVILAFMSAMSLQQFGVEIYVADLISIALFRELGPIITSIILAGRTGSAFAAELGTMKVNEEIDALTTFDLSPVAFLTLPRVFASTVVMPALTIFAVAAGLLGGAIILLSMDIPAVAYWQHVAAATSLTNVVFGLGKSMVFGLLVGMVGCFCGLNAGRASDSVGAAATSAVVSSLVLITAFDGLFAVLAFFTGV